MKNLLMTLFRPAKHAPTPEVTPAPAAAPAPRKTGGKRKLKGKRRAVPGARKIDPNGPWLEQAKR